MSKQEDESEIELRSEEYNYILAKTPNWVLRWGISFLCVLVVLIVIGTALFKYPDTISTSFILTGSTPPARIKAKATGILSQLYIEDNQSVKKGNYLAIIQNSAKDEDVIQLKKMVAIFLDDDTISLILPPKNLQLGDMHTVYLSFYQTLYNYREFKQNNFHGKKIKVLQSRIIHNEKNHKELLKQQDVIRDQYKLKEKQFKRDSLLNVKGVISAESLENTSITYLESRYNLLSTNSSLDNIEISHTQMVEALIETENDLTEKTNQYNIQIRNYISQLNSEIQAWEMNYVLIAPIDGKVSFNNLWTENQNVTAGEDIFNIIPPDNGVPLAKVNLPLARSGKVKVGQKVKLHLANFPDNEYGTLEGTIQTYLFCLQ